ncbi:sensor histidine kinase [Achromobacter aloeverae]
MSVMPSAAAPARTSLLRAFLALPRPVRRRFAVMLLPWLVVFATGFPWLWAKFDALAQEPLWREREGLLDESMEILRRTLDSVEHDVLFLSDMSAQLPRDNVADGSPMARLYMTFSRTAGVYDQVRWLGQDGRERLRVNWRVGSPVLASPSELQDKVTGPYFEETRGTPPGSVYFSQINLNEEHGGVERPLVPTLRVATPLYEHDVAQGVVVLNYRVSRLLSRLNDLARRQGLTVLLLNDSGYWLQGPEPDDDWAWQLGAPQRRVSDTDPALWRALSRENNGRYRGRDGDYAFRRLRIGTDTFTDMESAGPVITKVGVIVLVSGDRGQAAGWADSWKMMLAPLMALALLVTLRYGWMTMRGIVDDEARAEELRRANQALREAYGNLTNVRADLSRAERLSSLGLMVAGVAHELNTPLGGASLAINTLAQSVDTLRGRLEAGLRKSELQGFLSEADEATRLADAAVRRASAIVRRFKQVAVDRTSMERRSFVLDEVVLDADPRLRKWPYPGQIELRLELEPGLFMDSYPGPLEQVIGNLLNNALAHAFDNAQGAGTLRIQAHGEARDDVVVRVIDDGAGIDAADLPHIFDPFYTTNRRHGGTGLGLHIVAQMVNEVLGGRIDVQSRRGGERHGTTFTLVLPRQAPAGRA